MISAVAFDLWETLITDTPELARQQESLRLQRIEAILRRRGDEHTAAQIRMAYRALWHRCYELYWSVDLDVPTVRQIVHLLEALELDPQSFSPAELEEIEQAYSAAACDAPPALLPHARETLLLLRSMDLRLGLVSNTGRTPGRVLRMVLRHHGLEDCFDSMVFSNEHGECKPRRSIFDRLCHSLEVTPAEVVFVGDNLYSDVFGAKSSGMRAIHFSPDARGLAVGPERRDAERVAPDATISSLDQLIGALEGVESWCGTAMP